MKDLISKKHKHLLWKDELDDQFLLLKFCEIFRYSEDVLRLWIWSFQKYSNIKKLGLILNEDATDDFRIVDINCSNLDKIIALNTAKRRTSANGKWLKDKEKKLGHKIIPHNPSFENKEVK